jgi:hypothetical protein
MNFGHIKTARLLDYAVQTFRRHRARLRKASLSPGTA